MIDYIKLRVHGQLSVNAIQQLDFLVFKETVVTSTGELEPYPSIAKDGVFTITVKSPTLLEISGSLHRFWTGGWNHNDFRFTDVCAAIDKLCDRYHLKGTDVRICNLEYGVNIKPGVSASHIIHNILCLGNRSAMRPYDDRPDRCFIEFASGEHFVKVYDKGKQYKTDNILRFEIKAKKARCLEFAGVSNLVDLKKLDSIVALGQRVGRVASKLVYLDPGIDLKSLKWRDRDIYLRMKDVNEWTKSRGTRTFSQRTREVKFKQIVLEHGSHRFTESVSKLIAAKVQELVNA